MESKLENLQKQLSLLKEENKRLKNRLKYKYNDKKNQFDKNIFIYCVPAVLITVFTEIGYIYNLAVERIILSKSFEFDIYFWKILVVLITIFSLLQITRLLYKKINSKEKEELL